MDEPLIAMLAATTNAKVGKAIAMARKAKNISIRKAAELAQVSTRQVQDLEGALKDVQLGTAIAIAKAIARVKPLPSPPERGRG